MDIRAINVSFLYSIGISLDYIHFVLRGVALAPLQSGIRSLEVGTTVYLVFFLPKIFPPFFSNLPILSWNTFGYPIYPFIPVGYGNGSLRILSQNSYLLSNIHCLTLGPD